MQENNEKLLKLLNQVVLKENITNVIICQKLITVVIQ